MSDIISHGCCIVGHPLSYFHLIWKCKILDDIRNGACSNNEHYFVSGNQCAFETVKLQADRKR